MPDAHGPVESRPETETAVVPSQVLEAELAPEEAGADLDMGLELGLAGSGYPAATRAGETRPLPPGLRARAIGRVQRQQGNFATQRMLKRAPVQRVIPGPGHPGTVDHNGVTPPDILALKNEETVWAKFKELYIKDGKAGINVFVHNTNIDLGTCAPEDREPIRQVLKGQQDRIDLYAERFIGTFEGNGRAAITEMLAASDAAIKQQMQQYGITEKYADDPDLKAEVATGEFTMNKDAKADDMAAAAKELAQQHKVVMDIKGKIIQRTPVETDSTMGERFDQIEKAAFQDPEFIDANQKYEQLFASSAGKYPVLAAFKDDPDKMATIGEKGASPEAATLIAKTLLEKQKNIQETQDYLDGGKLSVWSLPNIISGTKTKMSLASGSFESKIVDEYKSDQDTSELIRKIALGAIGAALGIISAVATAGGSLVVAAGAAAGGVVISASQLKESVEDYQVTNSAANTDLDKAKSVSKSDASLFWVAVDLIAAGMDIAAAGAAFKALAGPIHAAIEAKIAAKAAATAEKAGQETAEAAKFSKTIEELDQAAKGVPEKAASKIKAEVQGELKAQIVDPDNPLSSAGFKGSLAEKGKGFGVYEAYIPGVKDKVVVKVYPSDDPELVEVFERELKGAEASGKTGIGPKCYGEVSVGEGKKAFAMEKVEGSMAEVVDKEILEDAIKEAEAHGDLEKAAELRSKLAKASAEAADTASKINQVTLQDVRAYGNRLIDQGFYVKGDLQGLVDGGGRWRPIDFQAHLPLPDQVGDPAAYAKALADHNFQIEEQVKHLVSEGPKPLPNAPVGTLPPYNAPPKPVQPFRRRRSPVQRASGGDDWLAERIDDASGGGQPMEPQTRARLEAGLGDNLTGVRIHTDTEAAQLAGAVDAVAFTSGRDIFFGPGTYQPGTSQGLELLAHEAAHTVQQASGPVAGTPAAGGVLVSDPADPFEQAAERAASEVMQTATTSQPPQRIDDTPIPRGQSIQRAERPKDEEQERKKSPAEPVLPEPAKPKKPEELV